MDAYVYIVYINLFFSFTNLQITVFTKCKESLHDGRRLENISWRLWYCKMATSSSAAQPGENDGWNEEAYLDEKMGDDVLLSTRDETLPALPSTPHISGK